MFLRCPRACTHTYLFTRTHIIHTLEKKIRAREGVCQSTCQAGTRPWVPFAARGRIRASLLSPERLLSENYPNPQTPQSKESSALTQMLYFKMVSRYYTSQFYKCWTFKPVPQGFSPLGSEFWSGGGTLAQMDQGLPEETWIRMPCPLR